MNTRFIDFLPANEYNERKKRKDEGKKIINRKGQRTIIIII
jgi:hypothetical protein